MTFLYTNVSMGEPWRKYMSLRPKYRETGRRVFRFLMPFCSISYRLPSGRLVAGVFPSVFLEWNDAPKCTRMQVIYSQPRRQHSSKVHETFENIVID